MPIPVGLQLGVELTNFVGPLTSTVFKLGSLAVREAIERSGSDELTELKLARILGRHKIDPALVTHFRSIVARSSHAPLSQFVKEIVLESGSGPTVNQALVSDNAALLSMVIQLSFLAFSHEQQSLSRALTQAVDEILTESKVSTRHGLNYVSLLGTVVACQQQTTAFSWEHHYTAIEHKLSAALNAKAHKTSRSNKRRRIPTLPSSRTYQQSVSDRALPFVILRALIISLESLMDLSENRLLDLSCDRGISSIVLWCYHIMGLSVLVRVSDATVYFGDGPYNITIEHCSSTDTSATLLQITDKNIPIFTLTTTDVDPYIQSDQRRDTRGFLRQAFILQGVDEGELREYAPAIVSDCIKHFDSNYKGHSGVEPVPPIHHIEANSTEDPDCTIKLDSMYSMLRPRITKTAAFLFDIDEVQLNSECIGAASTDRKRKSAIWSAAMALVYALSRVKELAACALFPLSLDAFDSLTLDNHLLADKVGFKGPIPDTVRSFEIICKLLVGRLYNKEYVSKAFLISSRGWSIFMDTVDAIDPADVDSWSLHIRLGVPSRDGIRKSRIIDGMGHLEFHGTMGVLLNSDPRISFWPGVGTAKLVGSHVGYHDHDAFTAVQTYEWAHRGQKSKRWRLGFREKQEISMNFRVYRMCGCSKLQGEAEIRRVLDNMLVWPAIVEPDADKTQGKYIAKHPEYQKDASRNPERIFRKNETWFFFVSSGSAARWLGLDGLDTLDLEETGYQLVIRGSGCCVQCAIRYSQSKGVVLL
ncbi:hypothetical protein FBEOM_12877 [Fusarium beomiforme]|uniref:Uncharacterized protein n=1 Tax=Fusarium beomiforme TaxID=44412 RepID=A0A9P5A6X0_9HYPO|nr:hypothetical protein FBEOM_12877 [Fusarium beomiforme]